MNKMVNFHVEQWVSLKIQLLQALADLPLVMQTKKIRKAMNDILFYVLVLAVFGFAGYGVSCLGEKIRGHHLTSEAEDILNNLWLVAKRRFSMFVFKGKYIRKIEREMKSSILEAVLRHALEEMENNGQESDISKLLEKEAAIVMKRIEHEQLQ